ncbi:hypothetical protein SUGI_0948820 [Cryptomeria japonica]|nr:hypothetical protein SUGI_0948820 [Cryptomeria japonica]
MRVCFFFFFQILTSSQRRAPTALNPCMEKIAIILTSWESSRLPGEALPVGCGIAPTWRSPYWHRNSSSRGFFDVYQAAHSVGHRNSSGRGFSDVYLAAHFAGHCNISAIGFSDVYQVAHFAGHCNCSAKGQF